MDEQRKHWREDDVRLSFCGKPVVIAAFPDGKAGQLYVFTGGAYVMAEMNAEQCRALSQLFGRLAEELGR